MLSKNFITKTFFSSLAVAFCIGAPSLQGEQPAPAKYTAQVESVTNNDFNAFIADGVVVVDFYADWCGPCKKLKPIFSRVASEFEGKAKFGKVNIDSAKSLAKKHGVTRIPTLILFRDGKEVKRRGPGTESEIKSWVESSLSQ